MSFSNWQFINFIGTSEDGLLPEYILHAIWRRWKSKTRLPLLHTCDKILLFSPGNEIFNTRTEGPILTVHTPVQRERRVTFRNQRNWKWQRKLTNENRAGSEDYRLTREETAPTLVTNKVQITKDNTDITSQTKQRFWWQDHWYLIKKLCRRQTSDGRLESKRTKRSYIKCATFTKPQLYIYIYI
jgi:hypothetical protein